MKKNNIKKPHRLFYNMILDTYNKYFKPTGKLVILVGPDGSGKSSMSNVMCENLGSNWFSDAVTYYTGQYTRRLEVCSGIVRPMAPKR